MKKMAFVIAVAAIALSGSVFAQDYQNNIGIYMDEAATLNCIPLPTGQQAGFLVLTQVTSTGVKGWEAKITGSNMFLTGVTPRGDAVSAGSRPDEYIFGLAAPLLPVGGAVVIADVDFALLNTDPAMVFVGPILFSLLGNGLPAYVDGDNVGHAIHPINATDPILGSIDDPIFIANGDCTVVANEAASFGTVKGLFR